MWLEIYLHPQAEYKRQWQSRLSRTHVSRQLVVKKSTLNSTKIRKRILLLTLSSKMTGRPTTSGSGLIVRLNFLLHIACGLTIKANKPKIVLSTVTLSNRPLGPIYEHEFGPVTLREHDYEQKIWT